MPVTKARNATIAKRRAIASKCWGKSGGKKVQGPGRKTECIKQKK